jgi:excisionase family DNA binding protein
MAKARRELLTVTEAAGELGVSPSTLWRMLRRGELASVRQSGRRLVPRSAVQKRVRAEPSATPTPLSSEHPLWRLVGAFKSGGKGAGSSDKYAALFG